MDIFMHDFPTPFAAAFCLPTNLTGRGLLILGGISLVPAVKRRKTFPRVLKKRIKTRVKSALEKRGARSLGGV